MRYFSEEDRDRKEAWLKSYPAFLRNLYRRTPTIHDYYDDVLAPLINKKIALLDAGCGEKGIMDKYKGECKLSVGIDLTMENLKRNKSLDYLLFGDLQSLPFKNSSYDIIITQWVLEHISNPKQVFKEFNRVLKPNGDLIIVTNSIYNPIMLISALLPASIRDKMKKKVFPSEIKEDTFPTYYKCNSKKSLDDLLIEQGFSRISFQYSGDISIFLFSKFIFILIMLFEKITDLKRLNHFKMHFIAHYKKIVSNDKSLYKK